MGKSVFLRQLQAALEKEKGTRIVLFVGPASNLTVRSCMNGLARRLGVQVDGEADSLEIFESYFAQDNAPERLVLLFDEFDRYAEKGQPSAQPPGRGFFNDLEASRRELPQLGILATGSIGIYVFRDVLGSSFLSRALHVGLRPFERGEAARLTAPFDERGTPLSDDVQDALFLASGGIPSLLTYGLQELWKLDEEPDAITVTAVYRCFEAQYRDYLRDLVSAIADPKFSDGPLRVWKHIQENAGRIPRSDLEKALGKPSGVLRLGLTDALYLLQAIGVVRIEGSILYASSLTTHPIPSLLNLPKGKEEGDDLRADFLRDFKRLLSRLHRSSVDFFRKGREDTAKQLVPESVFAAHMALGFELLGWHPEREAQRGAGRTDLLLRRNGDAEVVVVEVKIWGRNDYKDAQRQVESYWTDDVAAGAVVQLTDLELDDWPERYRRECLESLDAAAVSVEGTPLGGHFTVASTRADGLESRVDHVLVRLPRKASR
jgi:hypothetical protein